MALIDKLTAIGDAIRAKNNTTELLTLDGMAEAIGAIESGGGDIPEEAFAFSGNCNSMFSDDKWKWFVDAYKDKLTFNNITDFAYGFSNSTYTDLSELEINCTNAPIDSLFRDMPNIENIDIRVNGTISYNLALTHLFAYCPKLRTIGNVFENFNFENLSSMNYFSQSRTFYNDYSLREINENFWDTFIISAINGYNHLYYGLFENCYALDGAIIPVNTDKTLTDNCFQDTFKNCERLKEIIFKTNDDGTPKVVNWGNQTIDLTKNVGYTTSASHITGYNSGITAADNADNHISDVYTFINFTKDNPNWFTTKLEWARYNRKSAVNTINSLPDTSAYLAANGGTNTIKFNQYQASGRPYEDDSNTGTGRIGALTEEEIAIATAKGWTITFA